MSNTIKIDTAERDTAGRGRIGGRRDGGRSRRGIGLAASVVLILGLAVGVTLGRTRPTAQPTAPQATSNPVAVDPHVPTAWDFREDRRELVPAGALDPEQQERGQVAPGALSAPSAGALDPEQLERTQVAPGSFPMVNNRLGPADEYGP